MHDKFSRRIETALTKLATRIDSSTKSLAGAQVNRQIGRILRENQRSAARFAITVQVADCPSGLRLYVAPNAAFDEWATISEGAYVLRTSIEDWSDEQLWKCFEMWQQRRASATPRAPCSTNSPASNRTTSFCTRQRTVGSACVASPRVVSRGVV